MNDASKIGREQKGEREDECMLEREGTCRREGSWETKMERAKTSSRKFGKMERKQKRKEIMEMSLGERMRARVRGRFREKIGYGIMRYSAKRF